MTFEELSQRFADAPSSIDATKVLYRGALELMREDPQNAALYFIIGVAGNSFVRTWEDQALTPQFLDVKKKQLQHILNTLLAALLAPPAERLRLAGEAAVFYEWSISDF